MLKKNMDRSGPSPHRPKNRNSWGISAAGCDVETIMKIVVIVIIVVIIVMPSTEVVQVH